MRSRLILAAMVGMLVFSTPGAMAAQPSYPDQPIRLIVHTKPGSPMDAMMRLMAKLMEARVPVPVIIENKPGGGSAVATTYTATSRNPAYTVAAVSNTHIVTPLSNKTPHSMADLRPVSFLFEDPLLLAVLPDKPWKDAREFLEEAKANPGKYKMGVAQVGSVDYLTVVYYARNGYPYTVVPFDSGGEVLTQLLGGHVDIAILEPSLTAAQIKAGKLRGLCSFTDERLVTLPEIQTITELGYPALSMRQFRGIMVPKTTPDDVVAYLHALFQDILANSPEFKEYCQNNELEIKLMTIEAYAEYLKRVTEETAEMLGEIGMLKKQP